MSPKSCIEVESSRIDVLLVTKYLQKKVTERSETPGEGKQLGLAQVTTFLALHIESSLDREASQQLLPKLSNASAEEIIISLSGLNKIYMFSMSILASLNNQNHFHHHGRLI